MAAGDVTIHHQSGRSLRGWRVITGTVQLDGSNPTPVALASYMKTLKGAQVSLISSAAPADDPSWLSYDITAPATLDVYAWKNTGGTDPTLVASTNNTFVVSFVAWGLA